MVLRSVRKLVRDLSGKLLMPASPKYVDVFGSERTEVASAMKNLLGGKGANLAEM